MNQPSDVKHTIAVYDPGHFHAALLFPKPSPRAGPVIHVYAPPGRDVEDFSDLINGFNCRDIDPTNWHLESHIGGDALEALIAERPGEFVTLAGKNGLRLPIMQRLHDQGLANNGRIDYRLRGIHVRQYCAWDLREAPGGDGFELTLAPDTGHEGQFPLMLDQFLDIVETKSWPA